MTEAEWLACDNMLAIWVFLYRNPRLTERKHRLYLCACCRRVWAMFTDERSRQAVGTAERHADGLITDDELKPAADAAFTVWMAEERASPHPYRWAEEPVPYPWSAAAHNAAVPYGQWGGAPMERSPDEIIRDRSANPAEEEAIQCALMRDIFGNPFRPVAFSPEWRADAAIAIASHMYESRDFSAMPILADALQDAGCSDEGVLNHCRAPGVHVRGCWVVDSVLGKG